LNVALRFLKNSLLPFTIKGAKAGDKVIITSRGSKGSRRTDEATIAYREKQ
jgi:sulfur-oxidizing protein SoxZ